ncbi:PAS domain S-box protein [Sorangium sp. So ce1389]|uniref:PAS domain S-box protein n=1 Tax=Sorangium sp. So ce1389 TaxID=3133336 RepID=UPI003F5EC9F2
MEMRKKNGSQALVNRGREVLLDSFLASCPEMLFVAGVKGELLRWSGALGQAFGSVLKENLRLAEIAHPEDRGAVQQGWSRLQAGKRTQQPVYIECRLRRPEGSYQRVSCALRRSRDGDFVHGSLREPARHPDEDIDELRRRSKILEALMRNVTICVWSIDHNGIFTYHDGKGLELVGMKPGELVGKNLFDAFEDTDEVRQALEGTPMHTFSSQDDIHWENWFVPTRNADEVDGLIGFTLDVTAAKRAEQELRSKLAQIEHQQQVIRDLSTPIIEVWDGVLTLPMVGVVDSVRVAEMMDGLLRRIAEKSARFAILDLTGVEVVDTKVASHLINIVSAIRLLGAEGIVVGIKPTVAQTMVALGLDLSTVLTKANLRAALSFAIRRMSAVAPASGGQ